MTDLLLEMKKELALMRSLTESAKDVYGKVSYEDYDQDPPKDMESWVAEYNAMVVYQGKEDGYEVRHLDLHSFKRDGVKTTAVPKHVMKKLEDKAEDDAINNYEKN